MSVKINRRITRSTAVLEDIETPSASPLSASRRTRKLWNNDVDFSNHIALMGTTENNIIKDESSSNKSEPNGVKRRIVKAKRLLHNKKTEFKENDVQQQEKEEKNISIKEKPAQEQNICLNLIEQSTDNSCSVKFNEFPDINEESCMNKSEKKLSKSVTFFDQNAPMDATFDKILDTSEQKRSSIESKFVITTLNHIISPSTSSLNLNTDLKSPEHLQFDCSEKILHPTNINTSPSRRRTFELETSINDITLLKSVSKNDSVRMNSFPSDSESGNSSKDSLPGDIFSNVTVRKLAKDNITDRVSRFSPPWSTSSFACTPQKNITSTKKQNSLLKNVLSKTNTKSTTKVTSSVKIPNFAAIHQRAYEKMENLSEYKQRKEKRAKMLLSGNKPIEHKGSAKNPNKKGSKKQLSFATDVVDREKSPTYIPLPSTPMPKFKPIDLSFTKNTPKYNFTKDKENSSPILTPKFTKKTPKFTKKTPNFSFAKGNELSVLSSPPKQYKSFDLAFKVGTPNFKFTKEKENGIKIFKQTSKINEQNGVPNKSKIPTKILLQKNNNFEKERFPLCNNGTNMKNMYLKKEELKTMVATKSKPMKNNAENRRTIIKGVRSNRRFELLMDMRKGK